MFISLFKRVKFVVCFTLDIEYSASAGLVYLFSTGTYRQQCVPH